MAQPPPGARGCTAPARVGVVARHQRRDGDQVIGVGGVPQPEHERQPKRHEQRGALEQAREPLVGVLDRGEQGVEAHCRCPSPRLEALRAGLAEARDREVAEAGVVAEASADRAPQRLELAVGERPAPAAALADQVGRGELARQRVDGRAVAQVRVAHQPHALEQLEVAIDRPHVRLGDAPARPGGDLLGRHRPAGGEEGLDEQAPCSRYAQALRLQGRDRVVDALDLHLRGEVGGGHFVATLSLLRMCCKCGRISN